MSGFQAGGQTDYSTFPTAGKLGMRYSVNQGDKVVMYPCAAGVVCKPGDVLEVVSGQVRPAQAAQAGVATSPVVGICVYDAEHAPLFYVSGAQNTPGYFEPGELVPVLRRGTIWAAWSGTTQGELVTANYAHSSDGTHAQGTITDAAAATTAGAEVTALPGGARLVRATGSTTMCLLEVNFPAS